LLEFVCDVYTMLKPCCCSWNLTYFPKKNPYGLCCWMLHEAVCQCRAVYLILFVHDEYMNAIMLCLNHVISRKSHDYTMLVLADDAWYLLFMSRAYLSDDDMLLCWSNHDVWCCWIHEPLPNPSSCTWEPRISYAIGQVHCSIGNSQ
jgi:hypothetical protein